MTFWKPLMHLLQVVPPLIVCGLLLLVIVADVRWYLIPNEINLAILVQYPIYYLLGVHLHPAWSSAAAFILVFLGFGCLWHIGTRIPAFRFGGGDWKLLSALAPWVGLQGLPVLLLLVAVFGGIETIVLLILRRVTPQGSRLRTNRWTSELMSTQGVPYGVSIASAGILVIMVIMG